MGAGIGAAIGGVVGALAGVLGMGAFQFPEESAQGVQQWKASRPGYERADTQEVVEAIHGYNNALAGIGATLGVFVGAIIGAKLAQPSAASSSTGTDAVPVIQQRAP